MWMSKNDANAKPVIAITNFFISDDDRVFVRLDIVLLFLL